MNSRLYKDKIPCVRNNLRTGNYLYTTNFSVQEESLCKMEIKYLFHLYMKNKYFFTTHYESPSRSPFIKHCISIQYSSFNFEDLIQQLINDNFYAEKYKIFYIKVEEENIGFHESRKIEYSVGMSIKGNAEMNNPKVIFGITKVSGKWFFGRCESNDYSWQLHKTKPYSYSNALNVEVSRALVNIAAGSSKSCNIVDPCCGIGTVVIEALSMGFDIKGYELNNHIGTNAKENLKHFKLRDVITIGDMNSIESHFNSAIVDLPYGLFTTATLEQQINIIKCARRIATKMVLISFEDMNRYIIDSGFSVMDKCSISKGKFVRYITVCQ